MREWLQIASDPWVMFGFFGQGVFMMRFVVQWWASEEAGESILPPAFWYFSIAGALCLIVYGWQRREPILVFGQALPLLIYLRNLFIIRAAKLRRIAAEE